MVRRRPRPAGVARSFATLPALESTPADRRSVSLLGLVVPWRATIALLAVCLLVMADQYGRLLLVPTDGLAIPDVARIRALTRCLAYVATAVALLALFRDRPARYGLCLGDVRAGLAITIAGCAALTPLYLAIAALPDFASYYAPLATDPVNVIATSALELVASEWLYRGVLTFALVRAIGPIGVIVAVVPFAFAHVGKPELETLSTLVGGTAYGWLAYRTRSVLYGTAAHIYLLSLAILAAGAR